MVCTHTDVTASIGPEAMSFFDPPAGAPGTAHLPYLTTFWSQS